MKFRKKPVVIDAYQFTQNTDAKNPRPDWLSDAVTANIVKTFPMVAHIETLEGTMRCDIGDWIICGVKGELYPCKPDIFAATYEPVLS